MHKFSQKPSKNDKKLVKSLLESHIKNVSFISPRDVVSRDISSSSKVINGIKCTIYISDGDYKGSNVFTKVEKIKLFKNYAGINAIAKSAFDENGNKCFRISVFEKPLSYGNGEEYCLNSNNDYKESFGFNLYSEKDLDSVIEKFVKNNVIEEPISSENCLNKKHDELANVDIYNKKDLSMW